MHLTLTSATNTNSAAHCSISPVVSDGTVAVHAGFAEFAESCTAISAGRHILNDDFEGFLEDLANHLTCLFLGAVPFVVLEAVAGNAANVCEFFSGARRDEVEPAAYSGVGFGNHVGVPFINIVSSERQRAVYRRYIGCQGVKEAKKKKFVKIPRRKNL
jgi:hypothetical protein